MKKRYIISFVVAIIILSVLFLWNVGAGSVDISTSDLFAILAGSGKDETFSQIVWKIRLPRILAAILLGGALSVSGFLLQSFFQNPIAGPYVLGISSGAKLVVALTMIFLLEKGIMISSFGMVMAAFVGSILAMGFVLLISFRVSKMSLLVVCGIMIGYICSAITDFCVTFASDSNIVNLHNWSMGSFSGMTWENIKMIVVIVGAAVLVTFCLAKPIGAYQMGEAYARNIGVNVKVLRVTMILLSSLLSACVTAFAGPISFVGIAVPHLVRMATKTARPIILIPGCFLCGAVVTLFCDGIARTVFAPTEISISSVTALFLVLMNLVGGVVAHLTSIADSYTLQLIAEIGVAIYAIGMLFLMGYQQSLKKTGVGFLRGFYIGGFMVGYCVYVSVAQLFLQSVSGSDGVRSAGGIIIYILTMFLVGMNEEVIMRGIVLNLFADRFSNTRRGVLAAIILSSVIFGAAHIPNVLSGVPLSSALIQALQATLLGVLFAAIYLRSGNLWICIIIHALVDFGGLMASGIFGNGDMTDMIGSLSVLNLAVTVPLFLIPCIVLLRRSKLDEIVEMREGEIIIPSEREGENIATVSLVLGILGIVTGFVGYGAGFGLVGLLGSICSKKIKPQQNGTATAALVTSIIGLVIAALVIVAMLFLMPVLGDVSTLESIMNQ